MDIREVLWRGADAWEICTDHLEVVVTRIGGNFAAIRTPGEELNPLWQPNWPSCHPADFQSESDLYGPAPDGPLLAGIVGHNLCLDRFGGPWPGENRPTHGESNTVEWTAAESGESVSFRANLPEAGLRLVRSLVFDSETINVNTSVSHGDSISRDVEWAEHVTIGDPFLDGALISAGVDDAWMSGLGDDEVSRFRGASDGDPIDVAEALAMPEASRPQAAGDIVTARVTDGWFRVQRPDLGKMLEYRWNEQEFPWLCLWTEHRSRAASPWNGQTRAKGLEFSTKPFPEGKPPRERAHSWNGRSTDCQVPPGEGLHRSFSIRWGRPNPIDSE